MTGKSLIRVDLVVMSPTPSITRLVLYVKDIPRVAAFYQKHFGFYQLPLEAQGWTELVSSANGLTLSFLQLSKGQKAGQSCVKFVFDVEDVAASKDHYGESGLAFGPTHEAEGYQFSNARDPAGNLIQISNRRFKLGY